MELEDRGMTTFGKPCSWKHAKLIAGHVLKVPQYSVTLPEHKSRCGRHKQGSSLPNDAHVKQDATARDGGGVCLVVPDIRPPRPPQLGAALQLGGKNVPTPSQQVQLITSRVFKRSAVAKWSHGPRQIAEQGLASTNDEFHQKLICRSLFHLTLFIHKHLNEPHLCSVLQPVPHKRTVHLCSRVFFSKPLHAEQS